MSTLIRIAPLLREHLQIPDTVEVNGEQIRAKAIVIATGATPVIPEAWQAFAEDILTTDELFELDDLPASLRDGLGVIRIEKTFLRSGE